MIQQEQVFSALHPHGSHDEAILLPIHSTFIISVWLRLLGTSGFVPQSRPEFNAGVEAGAGRSRVPSRHFSSALVWPSSDLRRRGILGSSTLSRICRPLAARSPGTRWACTLATN